MARKYQTHIREEKAVEVVVSIPDLEEYKNAWLIIQNNAKSCKEDIYKVYNDYGDNIYMMVHPDMSKQAQDFLSQFGEVVSVNEDKLAVVIDVVCDYDDFDEDYADAEAVFGEIDL